DFYDKLVNNADESSVSQPTCDGHKLTISCKANQKIHIVKAFYGKAKKNTKYGSCQKLDVGEATFPCSKNNVLNAVINRCEERENCVLDLTTDTFKMSKCENIVKNLVVSAVCVELEEKVVVPGLEVNENSPSATLENEPDFTTVDSTTAPQIIVDEYEKVKEPQEGLLTVTPQVCDGQKLKLKCTKQDALIHIISAFYGKPESDTKYGYCQKRDFTEAKFPCYSTSVVENLRNVCENKKVCQIDVANQMVFDDSCGKIGNHLVVKFVCVYPFEKIPEIKDVEGNDVPIDSPEAELIEPIEETLKDVPEENIPSVIEENYDSLESPKEPITSTKPVCDGDTVRLICEEDETLHIISAFYGKVEADKGYGNCPAKDFFPEQFPCYDAKVLGRIQDMCEERKDCSIMVSSESFQSSICPKVRKNLVVNFVCVKHPKFVSYVGSTVPESSPTALDKLDYLKLPDVQDKTPEELEEIIPDIYDKTLSEKPKENVTRTEPVCDGQTVELRCNNGELMHIVSAYYGKPRVNQKYGNCLSIDQNSVKYPCYSAKTLEKVTEICEFTQSCQVEPEKLLSPTTQCGGIVQHLIVEFVCVVLDNMPTEDVILYPVTVAPVDPIVSQTTNLANIIKNVPKSNIGDKTVDFYDKLVNNADES
ncbi:hypothetical protein SNEBB_007449, partial [Seison nebaliae]